MKEWLRKIPHPTYGHYGGASARCKSHEESEETGECPIPIDWMDKAFQIHDEDLRKAKTKAQRKKADKKLGNALRKGKVKKLKRKIYGALYRQSAMLVFKD